MFKNGPQNENLERKKCSLKYILALNKMFDFDIHCDNYETGLKSD